MPPATIPRPRTQRPEEPRRPERGSVSLIVAAGVALAAVMAIGVARVGDASWRRARADATADMVALAAVTGGDDGSRAVAAANGAEVRSVRRVGDTVVVDVVAAGVSSSAAARPAG